MMAEPNGPAKIIPHPAWPDIDVNALHLPEKQAVWLFEQVEERLKAQSQAYISIQSRAVTFAGVMSALSAAAIGGIAALYLQVLDEKFLWVDIFPLIGTGAAIAVLFTLSMAISIWVSTPSNFYIVGYYPRDPKEMIRWLNHNSEQNHISITSEALNYAAVVKENEVKVAEKSMLLLKSQKAALAAFPVALLVFGALQVLRMYLK
jgi:hypothetical protein